MIVIYLFIYIIIIFLFFYFFAIWVTKWELLSILQIEACFKIVIYNYVLCWLLFYDKKCCNYFNVISCILWDFIILGLVLSWWRIEHVLEKQKDFMRRSREACEKLTRETAMWEAHDWKLRSRARLLVLWMSHG